MNIRILWAWIAAVAVVAGPGAAGRAGAAPPEPKAAKETVETTMVGFDGGAGPIKGFLARPRGDGPFPAIVVVHEWWGLSDWVKRNAERLAAQGYVALAVDLYGGKVTGDPDTAHQLMRALDDSEAINDLKGGIAYLKSRPDVAKDRKLAAIGWCMGGKFARLLAQASDAIGPTVICYGSISAEPDQVAKLGGKPVLGIFGAEDKGIPASKAQQFADALKAKGSPVELHVYPGAGHGFMRPGGPQHDPKAADDAWKRITDFLAANLKH